MRMATSSPRVRRLDLLLRPPALPGWSQDTVILSCRKAASREKSRGRPFLFFPAECVPGMSPGGEKPDGRGVIGQAAFNFLSPWRGQGK